jgi:phage terminase small subunit
MASSKENTKDITPDTPVEKLDLTTKQNKFVEYYCQGYTGVESAKLAGYDSDDYNTLHAIASENLRKPTIVAAIKDNRKDLRYRFQEEAGNAIRVILEIMNNSKVSGRTRLDAAKDLLDRAGYKPSDKIELSGVDGNPIEYETRQTKEIDTASDRLNQAIYLLSRADLLLTYLLLLLAVIKQFRYKHPAPVEISIQIINICSNILGIITAR